jgi:hypothetical protein
VSEIKKVARKEPALAADGAVMFIERLSPAIERVDSSSGAMGGAVYKALADLSEIISKATVADEIRAHWLDRLYMAILSDEMSYLESMCEHWGKMCASKGIANLWVEEMHDMVKSNFRDANARYMHASTVCLSAMITAERYDELMALLNMRERSWWHYDRFGIDALVAQGKYKEALEFAKSIDTFNLHPGVIAAACEKLLLAQGEVEKAYTGYALTASQDSTTYIGAYRAIAKRYPTIPPERILNDLISSRPGEEGKWFATAKELGMLELAAKLSQKSHCDPLTLNRAAKEHLETNPQFALDVAMASLHWMFKGYGYDLIYADVLAAYFLIEKAAKAVGKLEEVHNKIGEVVKAGLANRNWVANPLAKFYGYSPVERTAGSKNRGKR